MGNVRRKPQAQKGTNLFDRPWRIHRRCSIIVMVSIGIGMTESQNQMLQNMGDLTIIEVSSGTSNTGQEMKLDDAAVETFSSIDGVQAVMPKMNCDYTVNLYAGLNNRYKAEWATLGRCGYERAGSHGLRIP